jgi:hypothetical protein
MKHRVFQSISLVAAVLTISLLAANPLAAQLPDPSPAPGYTMPRTPDGHPDLGGGGFWSNATYTRLQRRDGVAGAFYTAQEVADIEARARERESAQTVPGNHRRRAL